MFSRTREDMQRAVVYTQNLFRSCVVCLHPNGLSNSVSSLIFCMFGKYQSASELYRPIDRRLSARLLPSFADRRCHVVCEMDPLRPYSLSSRPEPLFFLSSSSSIVLTTHPDPLLLRKSGSAGNRTWTSGSVARNSDH
jgi:hypothetical protein